MSQPILSLLVYGSTELLRSGERTQRAHCAVDTCRVTHNKHHSPESPVSTNGLGSREGVPNRGKAPCGRGGSGEEEGWMRTDVPIHEGHALLTLGENPNVMTCLRLTCLYRVRSQALSLETIMTLIFWRKGRKGGKGWAEVATVGCG